MTNTEKMMMIAGVTAMSFGARPRRQYQPKPKLIQSEQQKYEALAKAQAKRDRKVKR